MVDDIEKMLQELGLTEDQIRDLLDEKDVEEVDEEVVELEGIDNPEEWN